MGVGAPLGQHPGEDCWAGSWVATESEFNRLAAGQDAGPCATEAPGGGDWPLRRAC